MSKNDHSKDKRSLERYFQRNPLQVIVVMSAVLILGFSLMMIGNFLGGELSRQQKIDDIFKEIPSPDSVENTVRLPSINDLLELKDMEGKMNRIMEKDSLTTGDSLFMLELNKKLDNIILYEKD